MIVYRRSEEEMPARLEEVKHAKEEGCEFITLTNPVEYIADERGRVKQVRVQKMALGEPDAKMCIRGRGGRFRISFTRT